MSKNSSYENCSHFWDFGGKIENENVQKYFYITCLYTVKYNESEYHIENNNLLYKIHQQCPNTFEQTQKK